VSLEDRVPKSHPLRKLKVLVDGVLTSMSAEFDAVYTKNGRPSIPPGRLLRALLLQVLSEEEDSHESEFSYKSWGAFPTDDCWLRGRCFTP
jgi:transposase